MKVSGWVIVLALVASGWAGVGHTSDKKLPEQSRPVGIKPIPDPELAMMRGRFMTGNGIVLYFGVEMLSNWVSPDGRVLSGGALLAFDFSSGSPMVTFTPTVSIVQGTASGVLVDTSGRVVDSSGLDNVSGLVQSTQIAGDGNYASNTTEVQVLSSMPANTISGARSPNASVTDGDASVSASLDANQVTLRLNMSGQGSSQQRIRGSAVGTGSVWQTIRITGDGHWISNQLRLTLVQPNQSFSLPLKLSVARSIGLLNGLNKGH